MAGNLGKDLYGSIRTRMKPRAISSVVVGIPRSDTAVYWQKYNAVAKMAKERGYDGRYAYMATRAISGGAYR